ncbi:MAG: site-specific DNA-methyltransferase [Candidatus Bathyarchaeia archaeon]|jgi:DNA modification methylase
MKTTHRIFFGNAADMHDVQSNSVDLMVTSPPYPMITMWDEIFSKQNPAIGDALKKDDGKVAFELMHRELDKVWVEIYRVLRQGGFACINVGDATRTIGGDFKLYPNHARILSHCLELEFSPLPEILWRKQTNAPNKFMGAGMLPAGAYVTLEHEFILILRKGGKRLFNAPEEKQLRRESAYFYEERNLWFSDVWQDLQGTRQNGLPKHIRERSGAYPFELPFRLISMFSVKGDTVLDPFLGTGTTALAAMATRRNSIGIEIDPNFKEHLSQRFSSVLDIAEQRLKSRIVNHLQFIEERERTKGKPLYENKHYGFPVVTNQETEIIFCELNWMEEISDSVFEAGYRENSVTSWEKPMGIDLARLGVVSIA